MHVHSMKCMTPRAEPPNLKSNCNIQDFFSKSFWSRLSEKIRASDASLVTEVLQC